MSKIGAILVLIAGSATAAIAAVPSTHPKPQLICRAAKQSTGSHIRTPKRCKTAEQWAAEDEISGRIPISLRVNQSQNDGTQKKSQ